MNDESRMIRIQQLTERVRNDEYEVDAEATAGAILARLLGGRALAQRPA